MAVEAAQLEVVILAAGKGTRMRSRRPKVLHTIAGRPLLAHVVAAARALRPKRIHVVIGTAAEEVREAFADCGLEFVVQAEPQGTGHAVAQALPAVEAQSRVLVLYGDVPLITPASLARLVAVGSGAELALMTATPADPGQLGRIVRSADGAIRAIVEYRDASPEQRQITEINTGIMLASARRLADWVARLGADNAQGEYYLTDIVAMAVAEGCEVPTTAPDDPEETAGINDRVELARDERIYQRRQAEALMLAGATLRDPARVDVRGSLQVGQDVDIDVDVVFEGEVEVADGARIGPHCLLRDCRIGMGAEIHANTVIDGAIVGPQCSVGPFARLRPGTELAAQVKIGNFVEAKKARVGRGSKASHLAYLGDAELGADCNVGAGTIVCNYDGYDKHFTRIGERVFIGSNSTLVAPLTIADDGFVAAGSTLTRAVPAGALAVARGKQRNVEGWIHPAERGSGAAESE